MCNNKRRRTLLVALTCLTLATVGRGQMRKIEAVRSEPLPFFLTAGAREVKVFLIAVEDNGRSGKKIGCNDSVLAVAREVAPTKALLRAALKELLRMPEKYESGHNELYNALHRSRLRLKKVSIRRGEARIHLAGLLASGGVCDGPRIQAQIEETARQFPTVKKVRVFINSTSLPDYLSERG